MTVWRMNVGRREGLVSTSSSLAATLACLAVLASASLGQSDNGRIFEPADPEWRATSQTHVTGMDPAYLENGELRIRKTDLTVPSVGFAFALQRIYMATLGYDGPLGYNWDFTYNTHLTFTTDNGTNVVDCMDGTGRQDRYTERYPPNSGIYDPPASVYDVIRWNSSNFERVTPGGFAYVYQGCSDDANRQRLWKMKDLNANEMVFAYDATTKFGKLTKVTDTNGREFTIAYTQTGRVSTISDFGTNPRTIRYEYSTAGDLATVTDLYNDPVDSTLARSTTYTYDSNHRVVTITDGKENAKQNPVPFCRNYYDTGGRVIAQEYGPAAESDNDPPPTSNAFLLSYDGANHKSVYTDRMGHVTEFWFDNNNLLTKKVVMNGGNPGPTEEYYYDSLYNLSRIHRPNGQRIYYAYDVSNGNIPSRGNLLSTKTTDSSGGSALEWTYEYEETHNQLTKATDPRGRYATYAYDARANLTAMVVDANSGGLALSTSFSYDASNRYVLDSMTNPRGKITIFAYDALRNVTKVVGDPSGLNVTLSEYSYDEYGNVTTAKDGKGNATALTLNRLNQVTKVTAPSPLSYETEFFYDKSDNVTQTKTDNSTEEGGGEFVVTMAYDLLDKVTSRTEDVNSSTTRATTYVYDADDKLTEVQAPEGVTTKYEYDGYDLNTKVTLGYGATEAASYVYKYDANFRLTRVEEPKGSSWYTEYAFDHHDRVTRVTNAAGHYVVSTYDAHRLEHVASYTSSQTLLAKARYYYDNADRLTVTEVMMKTSGGTDIGDGWMTSTLVYDANGNVTTSRDEGSHETHFTYDALDRVSVLEDPIGNKVTFTYDAAHNVITRKEEEKEQGGSTFDTYEWRFEFDNLNRTTKGYDPANNTSLFTYSARGNVLTTEDATGSKAFFTYDEQLNLLTSRVQRTSSESLVTKWAFDKRNRMTLVKDAKDYQTSFGYDKLDRTTSETFADGYSRTYAYDANSNIVTRTDQNNTQVYYLYDVLNRLTEKDFAVTAGHIRGETSGKNFWYDALNRLTKAEDTDSRILYVYNSANGVETEEMQYGTVNKGNSSGKTVAWTYNAQGLAANITYPGATTTNGRLNYSYDDANRLTQVKRQETSSTESDVAKWKWKGPSRVIRKEYGNGTWCDVAYDSRKLVSSIVHGRGTDPNTTKVVEMSYGYDASGTVTTEAIKHYKNDGTLLEDKGYSFFYDKADRLTKLYRGVAWSQVGQDPPSTYTDRVEYTFDDNGNRVSVVTTPSGGSDATDSYTANNTNAYTQITWSPSTTENYVFDKAGNRTGMTGTRTWYYDYQNKLVEVLESESSYVKYDHDALGRRMAKHSQFDGVDYLATKRHYYAGAALIQEYDVQGEGESYQTEDKEREYYWGQTLLEPVMARKFDVVTGNLISGGYYHQNQHASVYALTDSGSSSPILENYRYKEYGVPTINGGDTANPGTPWGNSFLWHGRYYDFEVTGLQSGVALYGGRPRSYDPESGSDSSRTSSVVGAGNVTPPSPDRTDDPGDMPHHSSAIVPQILSASEVPSAEAPAGDGEGGVDIQSGKRRVVHPARYGKLIEQWTEITVTWDSLSETFTELARTGQTITDVVVGRPWVEECDIWANRAPGYGGPVQGPQDDKAVPSGAQRPDRKNVIRPVWRNGRMEYDIEMYGQDGQREYHGSDQERRESAILLSKVFAVWWPYILNYHTYIEYGRVSFGFRNVRRQRNNFLRTFAWDWGTKRGWHIDLRYKRHIPIPFGRNAGPNHWLLKLPSRMWFFRGVGYGLAGAGVAVDLYNVGTASDKGRAIGRAGGGWLGAWAGVWAGVKMGGGAGSAGGPLGAFAGAVIGGMVGAAMGEGIGGCF